MGDSRQRVILYLGMLVSKCGEDGEGALCSLDR